MDARIIGRDDQWWLRKIPYFSKILGYVLWISQMDCELGLNRVIYNKWRDIPFSILAFVVTITSYFKFKDHWINKEYVPRATSLRDMLTINYMPKMSSFGRVFYGLVFAYTSNAFIWRIYMGFYRPFMRFNREAELEEAGRTDLTLYTTSELFRFLLDGPIKTQERYSSHPIRRNNLLHPAILRAPGRLEIPTPDSFIDTRPSDGESEEHERGDQEANRRRVIDTTPSPVHYTNPLYKYDFFQDYSLRRYRSIMKAVSIFAISSLISSLPYIIINTMAMRTLFSVYGFGGASEFGTYEYWLTIYGYIEQIFVIIYAETTHMGPRYVIIIMFKDLEYRARVILERTEKLTKYLSSRFVERHNTERENFRLLWGLDDREGLISQEQQQIRAYTHELQLFVQSYFEMMDHYNHTVSRYNNWILFAVIESSIVVLSSYDLELYILKLAGLLTGSMSVLYVAYLFLIGMELEHTTGVMYTSIMSLIAREQDFVTRYQWIKVIYTCFDPTRSPTFTCVTGPMGLFRFLTFFIKMTIKFFWPLNRLYRWGTLFPELQRPGRHM